jgi:triosephosphate isomerase
VNRSIIMAGNWKMHKTVQESVELIEKLAEALVDVEDREILVCPPFTALSGVAGAAGDSNIQVGAQNLYPAEEGAYTGEISPKMLVDLGCSHVIVGHSERRQYFQESDEFVNEKLKAASQFGLRPILCLGETLEQREEGRQREVVRHQIQRDLRDISSDAMKSLAIAYEPIWAIGTGHTATPHQANEMHEAIREVLDTLYGGQVAQETSILYGGSVKPGSVDDLMAQPEVDGALVGGAALEADSFIRIVRFRT